MGINKAGTKLPVYRDPTHGGSLYILYLIEKYKYQNMQYFVKLTRRPAGVVGTRFKSDRSVHEKVDFWYVLV